MYLALPHSEPSLAQELLDWIPPACPLFLDPLAEARCRRARTAEVQPMGAHRQGYPMPWGGLTATRLSRESSVPSGPPSSRGWVIWVQALGCCLTALAALHWGHVIRYETGTCLGLADLLGCMLTGNTP